MHAGGRRIGDDGARRAAWAGWMLAACAVAGPVAGAEFDWRARGILFRVQPVAVAAPVPVPPADAGAVAGPGPEGGEAPAGCTGAGVAAVVVLGGLVCGAGCTIGDGEPTPSREPTVSTAPEPEPSLAVPVSFELGGQRVDLQVGPVVAGDGYATLPVTAVDADPERGAREVALGISWSNPYDGVHPGPAAVRLVDPTAGTVSTPAHGGDGRVVMSRGSLRVGVEPVVACAVFALPQGETTDVLLPYAGYVADVPVVPAGEVGELLTEVGCELSDLTESAPADLVLSEFPLDTYVEQLGGDVRTRSEDDAVTVAVSADVLFATDSAELGAAADEALTVAGGQIADFAAGQLVIVGHTDDVASHAYNDELSVRRAQAVADRLADLVDLSAYDVAVEGRGKREPVASGRSDEARAANRRVELEFTPSAGADAPDETTVAEPTGEMPPADGPEATGAEGVRITDHRDRTFLVSIDQVRRIGLNLVGELTVERVGGEGTWSVAGLFSSGAWDGRGEFDAKMHSSVTNVTLLVGTTRHYPLDYVRNERGSRDPLADRNLNTNIEEGQPQTVTVVWPNVPGDTVTVDVPPVIHSSGQQISGPPFRLTDVPVVDG